MSSGSDSVLGRAGISTSEQLVKALRVPQSPPNGVSKVDIAIHAWEQDSLLIPKKAELLSQWVLEYLCSGVRRQNQASTSPTKGKGKAKANLSLQEDSATQLDLEAWQLLANIIDDQVGPTAGVTESARRSWLSHLANTQPVLLLSSALAKSLSEATPTLQNRSALLTVSSRTLQQLLPPASSRTAATNIENVTDSLQAWMEFRPADESEIVAVLNIIRSIDSSWRIALQYGSNSKRNHQHFVHHSLKTWVQSRFFLSRGEESVSQRALSELLDLIASESLFTDDVIRSILQAGQNTSITERATWSRTKQVPTGVVGKMAELLAPHHDASVTDAMLEALPSLSCSLTQKSFKSEFLNQMASSSSLGSVKATQQALVRKSMLSEFFFPLLPYLTQGLKRQAAPEAIASCRRGLLSCIELEGLYTQGAEESHEWFAWLQQIFRAMLEDLNASASRTSPTDSKCLVLSFEGLESLWRLDSSIIEPDLAQLLAAVAIQPIQKSSLSEKELLAPRTQASFNLFLSITQVYVKTRALPDLICSVLQSLVAASKFDHVSSDNLQSGLFSSQSFSTEFRKICRDSLTSVQVAPLINQLREEVNTKELIKTSSGTSPQASKKRRTATRSTSLPKAAGPMELDAIACIQQLLLAAQILQSVNIVPALRSDCILAAERLHNDLILPLLDNTLELQTLGADQPQLAAAALRARQALLAEKWRYDPSEPAKLDGSPPAESLPSLESTFDERADSLLGILGLRVPDDATQAGLSIFQLQILQNFLHRAERDLLRGQSESRYCKLISEANTPITVPINELLTQSRSADLESEWNGSAFRLRNRDEMLQALWTLILTRWAGLFEKLASEDVMASLASIVVSTAGTRSRHLARLHFITSAALKDASFLELTRWRVKVLECVFSQLDSGPDTSEEELFSALASTSILVKAPLEWLPRAVRGVVLRKLLALDQHLTTQQGKVLSTEVLGDRWPQLRLLLGKLLSDQSLSSDIADQDIVTAMVSWVSLGTARESFDSASLYAFEAAVRYLQAKGSSSKGPLVDLLQQLEGIVSESQSLTVFGLKQRAAQVAYAILIDTSKASGPNAEEQTFTHARRVDDKKQAIIRSMNGVRDLTSTEDLDHALSICMYQLREIRLNLRGLKIDSSSEDFSSIASQLGPGIIGLLSPFGHLSSRLHANPAVSNHGILEIKSEYLRCVEACGDYTLAYDESGTKGRYLASTNVTLAYSAMLSLSPPFCDHKALTTVLADMASTLSPEAYNDLLQTLLTASRVLLDALRSGDNYEDCKDRHAGAMVTTIGIIICNGPEGTSKFARRWLTQFLGQLILTDLGPASVLTAVSVIQTIDLICSSKAMLLRTQDLGLMFQLFCTILAPSLSDSPAPYLRSWSWDLVKQVKSTLFNGIVRALGSMVRLRQDLILSFLPQLASLLSLMCGLFRRVRQHSVSQASGLHHRQLRRELPYWLDPIQVEALTSSNEARAFSRLLSSLSVKHVSLTHSFQRHRQSDGNVKAESLSRAFSKHATYVLVAYFRTLTSPNTMVPPEVRGELDTGMTTLCGMIGHHQRDAAMVGLLDPAGKILLKRLWKEYEKGRYKGE